MRKIYSLILVLILGTLLFINFSSLFSQAPRSEHRYYTSQYYIDNGVEDTGAINLVTAILFDYRGFDTLGEATVIFIAALTISLLASPKRIFVAYTNFSSIVFQSISFIIPFLYLLGIYLMFYGHLSPGGGFAGGVIIATIFILLTITFGIRYSKEEEVMQTKSRMENIGALGFILIGGLGILAGHNFLANGQANFLFGNAGDLISAGTIPALNLMVGIKVGAGLSIIFNRLVKEEAR